MSTILKALKKLEQEKRHHRAVGPTPVFSKPQATADGAAGWFRHPWVQWGAVGFIIVVLGVVAFQYYGRFRPRMPHRADQPSVQSQPSPIPGVPQSKSKPTVIPPMAGYERNPQGPDNAPQSGQLEGDQSRPAIHARSEAPDVHQNLQNPAGKTKSEVPVPAERRPLQAARPAGEPSMPIRSESRRPSRQTSPVADLSTPVKEGGPIVAAPPTPPPEPKSGTAKKTATDRYENTPELTDGRLKVHAIAWSPKAEERMAVLNNRVVYEGDSVEDFTIVVIRLDDVVVREKEKGLWRVVFGRP